MMSDKYSEAYRKDWMTDDQWECYQMLADINGGFHHLHGKVHEWGYGIKFNTWHTSGLSTFDFDLLTRAVIVAHDRMIRFSVVPSGPRMVGFELFKRHSRSGSMSERHPTIEESIKRIRQ